MYLGPTLEILIPRGWDGRLFLKQPTDIMLTSWACNLCSLTGPHANKGPILSLILCCSHHNILFFLSFIYLSILYTQCRAWTHDPPDQESCAPMTEAARHAIIIFLIILSLVFCLPLFLITAFICHIHNGPWYRIAVDPKCMGVQDDPKWIQGKLTTAMTKWEYTDSLQEAMFSAWTRICIEGRKKAVAF